VPHYLDTAAVETGRATQGKNSPKESVKKGWGGQRSKIGRYKTLVVSPKPLEQSMPKCNFRLFPKYQCG